VIKYLSYYISNETPLYGNGKGIHFSPDKEMIKGDSCNTINLAFPNHSGTHIDFPYHFNPEGKTINDYPAEYWQFDQVKMADLTGKVGDGQIISPELFNDLENSDIDLLLIKTGYGEYRGTDRYTITPPGLSADLAPYFRQKYPKLRCVGMDLISVSSYSNREEGRKAHHAFLNPYKSEPILLIEDMKLNVDGPFNTVIVAPLLIDNADGAPCTVLAYTE
jgi:kynurenine formamidase